MGTPGGHLGQEVQLLHWTPKIFHWTISAPIIDRELGDTSGLK